MEQTIDRDLKVWKVARREVAEGWGKQLDCKKLDKSRYLEITECNCLIIRWPSSFFTMIVAEVESLHCLWSKLYRRKQKFSWCMYKMIPSNYISFRTCRSTERLIFVALFVFLLFWGVVDIWHYSLTAWKTSPYFILFLLFFVFTEVGTTKHD